MMRSRKFQKQTMWRTGMIKSKALRAVRSGYAWKQKTRMVDGEAREKDNDITIEVCRKNKCTPEQEQEMNHSFMQQYE